MTKHFALLAIIMGSLSACSPNAEKPINQTRDTGILYTEFVQSCKSKREHETLRRTGKVADYCKCFFNATMKDLSEQQKMVAALYLYGEQNQEFLKRFRESLTPQEVTSAMAPAAEAIGKARHSCR